MNKANSIIDSLVTVNEDMRSVSRKNDKIPYKISNSTFNLAKKGVGISNSLISKFNKNIVIDKDFVYSVIGYDTMCVIPLGKNTSNFCFGIVSQFAEINGYVITDLYTDFKKLFTSLSGDGCVAYDLKSNKIVSFEEAINKSMHDKLPSILALISNILGNNMDVSDVVCDVTIRGVIYDDAIEVILDCEVDTIKIDGNFDDICSCIDYVYDTLLGDKKKYGISRVTNKDVTSITFDIVL